MSGRISGEQAANANMKAAGKAAAATHDKVNFVWFVALIVLTMWPFLANSPFEDAEKARFVSLRDAGWDPIASDTAPRVSSVVAGVAAAASGGFAFYFVAPIGVPSATLAGVAGLLPLAYAAYFAWQVESGDATFGSGESWRVVVSGGKGKKAEAAAAAAAAAIELVPVYTILTWGALLYSLFDLAYMFFVPECTLKAATLVPHHLATVGLTMSALEFGAEPLTALCMLVEWNTLVLTLMNLKRAPPSKDVFLNACKAVAAALPLKWMFNLTWLFLRLGAYPYLLYYMHNYFGHERYGMRGYYQTMGSLGTLNLLNFMWTYENFAPKPAKKERSS